MQIEAYRDMITPVVDAFKYLTQACIFLFVLTSGFMLTASTCGIIICDLIMQLEMCDLIYF